VSKRDFSAFWFRGGSMYVAIWWVDLGSASEITLKSSKIKLKNDDIYYNNIYNI
jgi:hypothetical protein